MRQQFPDAAIDAIIAGRNVPIVVRQVKYLNNIVEQDHRAIKRVTRPMLNFKSFLPLCLLRTGRRRAHAHDPQGSVHDRRAEIRKVTYTTNAIESINMSLRKVTKARSSFPTDEAVSKLFYLALNNISKKWTMPIRDWKAALNRFAIQFEDRLPQLNENPFTQNLVHPPQL